MNHAGFTALAGRVEQDFLGFAGYGAREPCLHEVLVDLACDKAVVLLEIFRGSLRAFDGRAFHLDTEHGFCGFAQRKAEESVTAVQVEEVVFAGERKHAARRLDEVVDLALVHLAEAGRGVLEAEMSEVKTQLARAKELLEGNSFGRSLRLQVVIRLRRVNVGMRRSHVIGRILQNFGNLFQFADNRRVDFLDVKYDDPVLVRAADDNPVERVGEGLVRRRDELVEQQAVNGVVLLGLQDAVVFVEPQVARLHVHAALAGGAVVAGHGACNDRLRTAGEAVHVPEFTDGIVLDLQLFFIAEGSEGFAVGGIGFFRVIGDLVGDGLFKEHAQNVEICAISL